MFNIIAVIAIAGCKNDVKEINESDMPISPILSNLDSTINDPDRIWFDLNDGYLLRASSRISLYTGNDNGWAIVFESTGYNSRACNVVLTLYYFGSNLDLDNREENIYSYSNTRMFVLNDGSDIKLKDGSLNILDSEFETMKIRDSLVKVVKDKQEYLAVGFESSDFRDNVNVRLEDFLRYLCKTEPSLLYARDQEKETCLAEGMQLLMVIDEWHHEEYKDVFGRIIGKAPSSYETYQMISEILTKKDTSLWRPKLKPNNHWRYWPEAGGL